MSDLVERLRDLHKQATVERSHYYVGKCALDAADRIEALENALRHASRYLSDLDYHWVGDKDVIWGPIRAALDPTAHIDWDILAEERLEQRPRAALAPEQDK